MVLPAFAPGNANTYIAFFFVCGGKIARLLLYVLASLTQDGQTPKIPIAVLRVSQLLRVRTSLTAPRWGIV